MHQKMRGLTRIGGTNYDERSDCNAFYARRFHNTHKKPTSVESVDMDAD